MKKICILSDSHSHIDKNIIKYVKNCDEIWHAGDIGDIKVSDELKKHSFLRAVYGNIDNSLIRNEFPEINIFTCEGLKILMIHIGGYPGKYTKQAFDLIKKHRPNIFICGHSHILKVIRDQKLKLIHINPGAIGKNGFHQVRTMINLKIKNKILFELNVIEFNR